MESLFIIYININRNKNYCYKTLPYIRKWQKYYYEKGKEFHALVMEAD